MKISRIDGMWAGVIIGTGVVFGVSAASAYNQASEQAGETMEASRMAGHVSLGALALDGALAATYGAIEIAAKRQDARATLQAGE